MIRRDDLSAHDAQHASSGGARLPVRVELDEATEALALAEDGRSPHHTPGPTPPSSAGSAARLWSAAGSARGMSASSSDERTSSGHAARERSSVSADARRSALVTSFVASAAGLDEYDCGASDSSWTTVVAAVGSLVYIFSHTVQEPHAPTDIVDLEVFSNAEKAREFLRWTILERRSDVDYAALLKTAHARTARESTPVRSPLRVRTGKPTPGHAAAMRMRIESGCMSAGDTAALKALMSGVLGAEAHFVLGADTYSARPLCSESWDDVGQGTVIFHEGGENGEFRETYRIEVKELF